MNPLIDPIEQAIAQIEQAITNWRQLISATAATATVDALQFWSKRVSELEEIRNRLCSLKNGSQPSGSTSQTSGAIRALSVEVTQGMINQNLLTLTPHVKAGTIRVGDRLIIVALPSGDQFQTELLVNGNKLQERGKIAKFYRDAGVRAGDVVQLTEVNPGHWQLKKRPVA